MSLAVPAVASVPVPKQESYRSVNIHSAEAPNTLFGCVRPVRHVCGPCPPHTSLAIGSLPGFFRLRLGARQICSRSSSGYKFEISTGHVLGVPPAVGFEREIVWHPVSRGDIILSHELPGVCAGTSSYWKSPQVQYQRITSTMYCSWIWCQWLATKSGPAAQI